MDTNDISLDQSLFSDISSVCGVVADISKIEKGSGVRVYSE